MRYYIIAVLIMILLVPQYAGGQTSANPAVFNLSADHELSAFASAPLVWQEGQPEGVIVNMTMSDFRVNISTINIRIVQFYFVEDIEGATPQFQTQNATDHTLTVSSPSFQLNQTLSPPRAADAFFLNISILAVPSGGGVVETEEFYSFVYPGSENSIVVERDNLVPVINLYGFPPWSYFQLWLPIYGLFLFTLLLPPVYVGVVRLKARIQDQEPQAADQEEDQDE